MEFEGCLKKWRFRKSHQLTQTTSNTIFMRWDRMYVERTSKGEKRMGFWHMNAHRPEVTLMSNTLENKAESWTVLVTESELRMTGISDSNKDVVMIFSRIHDFPN